MTPFWEEIKNNFSEFILFNTYHSTIRSSACSQFCRIYPRQASCDILLDNGRYRCITWLDFNTKWCLYKLNFVLVMSSIIAVITCLIKVYNSCRMVWYGSMLSSDQLWKIDGAISFLHDIVSFVYQIVVSAILLLELISVWDFQLQKQNKNQQNGKHVSKNVHLLSL